MDANSPGFVYAIQMEGHPIYKIGKAVNLPRRMSQIGVQLPFKYRIVFAYRVPCAQTFESILHHAHAATRKNGEWFELTERELRRIEAFLLFNQSMFLTEWLVYRLANHMSILEHPEKVAKYARAIERCAKRTERRRALYKSLKNSLPTQEVEAIQ